MMKDAILWALAVGFIMFFKANEVAKGKYQLKEALIDNLKLTAVIEFIVNLYVFNFWIELLFVPFMTILAVMITYSEKKKEYAAVHKLFNVIATIIGLYLVYHAIKYIITDFKGFATLSNLDNFLYPIIMTVLYMPFIYLMSLYMAYEEFFIRIRIAYRHNQPMEKFARTQVIKKGKLSLSTVIAVAKNLKIYNLAKEEDFMLALKSIKTKKSR